MKLVAKYTLVLVAAIAIALSLITVYRMNSDRESFENDMGIDHRVVGRVLQAIAVDQWREQGVLGSSRGPQLIQHLIDRANDTGGPTRFEWKLGAGPHDEVRGVEGDEYVSRFPVRVSGVVVGAIIVRESLYDTERLVHHGIVISVISVGLVVGLSLVASLVLGRWLVGKPISRLVDKARRVGRREFGGAVELRRTDELGELASAMNAMSGELAQALSQITIETDARVRAVEQMRHADRLSTVGKLAAGIAHELGTPLSIVAGHAQMIASREVAGDAALDSAHAIDREATRMSRIVRQLLDFARRRGPEGSTSDVKTIAERCLALLAPMAVKAGVETELRIGAPIHVLIDENNLQQVLTNLLVNALQAMPSGGALRVSAALERGAPPDEPRRPMAPCVRIDVADTGSGIAAEALAHIFEPFFTTKQPGDGTGLGLAVIYGIVSDHRGWITVDTSERGTTFSIYLQEAPT
ncbi:MAG TPA: ATP-binding protein [Kofleriaceae bacterium]|jgi:signal transduction histidine kinase|nr:ATP-binding protein [Kofleriaceae bacterium]